MQVNTITDHVTHAVISNKTAREAQISSSAEFFNVLSNTLYSNKKLAVIREVLCNAWDIHIQQGITDTPVEITLAKDKLTIRDFGTGIHDDHIVDVYLTYGNSTKKLDGTQTGGFGLGSKAPWAYVEHFEVTSFHEGVKTIYAMSKSSGEVAGKPSALPILSVPTTETGLQVSFAIQHRDFVEFSQIIHMIAKFGEMNVLFNGDPLPTIPFSEAKHGFTMMQRSHLQNVSGGETSRVFIRYGNVIYPLENHSDLTSLMQNALVFAERASGTARYRNNYNGQCLIFQAKPNTISVTPSRESLSMTDHTVKNVKELLQDFINLFQKNFVQEVYKLTDSIIEGSWVKGRPADLLTSDNCLPGHQRQRDMYSPAPEIPERIVDVKTATKAYLDYNYPDFTEYKEYDLKKRLAVLEASGYGNRGKIQSFRRAFSDPAQKGVRYNRKTGFLNSEWFQRVLVQPILRKMADQPDMNPDKFVVFGKHQPPIRKNQYYRSVEDKAVTIARNLSPRPLAEYMPFLRNFVVLAYNRLDIIDRLQNHPAMINWFGDSKESFGYIVPRTDGKADIARAFFESLGMYVVDLTKPMRGETVEAVLPAPKPVIRKPRKKGLPLVSEIVREGVIHEARLKLDETLRTETPEFIVHINAAGNIVNQISWLRTAQERRFLSEFGGKGGVVVNANQFARFRALGIPDYKEWLVNHILDEMETNPRIESYLALRIEGIKTQQVEKLDYRQRQVIDIILRTPELAKSFNVEHQATHADIDVFNYFQEYREHFHYKPSDRLVALTERFDKIVPNSKLAVLVNGIIKSSLYQLLDIYNIESLFMSKAPITPTRKKQREGAIDLLQYAIEG